MQLEHLTDQQLATQKDVHWVPSSAGPSAHMKVRDLAAQMGYQTVKRWADW